MKKFLLFGIALLMACGSISARELTGSKLDKLSDLKSGATAPLRMKNQPKIATRAISYEEPSGEWTDWEVYGTGTLTLSDILDLYEGGLEDYEGSYPGLTLYWRQDVENAGVQQFKLEGVFNDADLVIDYYPYSYGLLKILPQPTNTENFVGEVDVMDFATAYEVLDAAEDFDMTQEEYEETIEYYNSYNYYVPDLGRLYVFLAFMVPGDFDVFGMGDMLFQLDGVANFIPDLENKTFFAADSAETEVEIDEAVAYAKYLISPGYASNQYLNDILTGADNVQVLEKSGPVSLASVEPNLLYNLMVVTFNDEDQPMEMNYIEFSVMDDQESEWNSLGLTTISLDILASVFTSAPVVEECEVQENISTPGLFRYVNPYGAIYSYNDEGEYDTEFNHYLIVDATNPDFVTVAPQFLGNDWGGGYFSAVNLASYYMLYGYTESEVTQFVGKYENGEITFPEDSFGVYCPLWSIFGGDDGSIYLGNGQKGTILTVPEKESSVNKIENGAIEPSVSYYNLQGVEIANPEHGSLVIQKSAKGVKKIVVK